MDNKTIMQIWEEEILRQLDLHEQLFGNRPEDGDEAYDLCKKVAMLNASIKYSQQFAPG